MDTTPRFFQVGLLPDTMDSAKVFAELADAMRGERHLLHPPADELRASFEDGVAILAAVNNRVIAYTRLVELIPADNPEQQWWELGSTWVHPSHRGRGINTRLYEEFLPRHRDKNILATTTNEASFRVGEHLHFVHVLRTVLPDVVWQASCVCPQSKTGTSDNEHCKLAHGEKGRDPSFGKACFFRVTPETATRLGIGELSRQSKSVLLVSETL